MSTPKRVNKSKEQLAYEMKQAQDTKRKREIVATVLVPLLAENTKTISQAKQFCKLMENYILSTFNEGMRQPLSVLDLSAKIEGEDNGAIAYRTFMDKFKDVPIGECLELIGGMPQAIEGALAFEDRERLFSDLEWQEDKLVVVKKDHN